MTIEERIECALDDLEGLILEGQPAVEALRSAAEPYGIKPEVLAIRAAPTGEFDQFVQRVLQGKAKAEARATITKAAREFRRSQLSLASTVDETGGLRAALAEALGREPTNLELVIGTEAEEAARIERWDHALAQLRALRIGGPPRLHTD